MLNYEITKDKLKTKHKKQLESICQTYDLGY